MKRITALLHAHRMGDIVHALEAAGQHRISIVHSTGLLRASSIREEDYSVQLGERVTQEIQLDVFCEADRIDDIVALLQRHGRTGPFNSGWIFVSAIEHAIPIADPIQ